MFNSCLHPTMLKSPPGSRNTNLEQPVHARMPAQMLGLVLAVMQATLHL